MKATLSFRRRALIKSIAGGAALATGVVRALTQDEVGSPASRLADQWRALSRVGYGPTPERVLALQGAPSAKAWALEQVDLAFAASRTPPRLAPDLAGINGPLPQLFAGQQQERQARAQLKAGDAPEQADIPAFRRMDFSGPSDPVYFNRGMVAQAAAWRLGSSSQPAEENPLLARMTEFWFNHLNIYAGKGPVRAFTGHYVINVARAHALGKFEDMLLASARHPAMLHYLDQVRSVAGDGRMGDGRGLNENYARELMELHTLGVEGGYSQSDVRELARILTGWTVDPNASSGFRFAMRMHDTGSKTLMGRKYPDGVFGGGEREGEQAIRWLAHQPQTARRISLRLAQFFVSDTPPPALVAQLAQSFQNSQGDMRVVLQALLSSAEFWKAENRLFKTPMDFACSALTAIQVVPRGGADALPDRRQLALTVGFLAQAGQPVHGWQTPDGYKTDAATWLAPEALTRRADYALAVGRMAGDMEFLQAFLTASTRATIAQERPVLRAGLRLASPDFMYK